MLDSQYITLYSAVDSAILHENARNIWKALYPKADLDTISEFNMDISGYFHFEINEKYFPRNTLLRTRKKAVSSLFDLLRNLNSNISRLNSDTNSEIPKLFGTYMKLINTYPVFHQETSSIWYWVSNFSIELNPGIGQNNNRRCCLIGESVRVEFVENQILRMNYCHLPVFRNGVSDYIQPDNLKGSWPIYQRVSIPDSLDASDQTKLLTLLPYFVTDKGMLPASRASQRSNGSELTSNNKINVAEPEAEELSNLGLFKQKYFREPNGTKPGEVIFRSNLNIYIVTGGYFKVKHWEKLNINVINAIFNNRYLGNSRSEELPVNSFIYAENPISGYPPVRELPYFIDKSKVDCNGNNPNNYFKVLPEFNFKIEYVNDLFDLREELNLFNRSDSNVFLVSYDKTLPVFQNLEEMWNSFGSATYTGNISELMANNQRELIFFITFCIFENILKTNSAVYKNIALVVGEINHSYLVNCDKTQDLLEKYQVTIFKDSIGLTRFINIENKFMPYSMFYKIVAKYFNLNNFVPWSNNEYNNIAKYYLNSNLIFMNNSFWEYENNKINSITKPDNLSHVLVNLLCDYYLNGLRSDGLKSNQNMGVSHLFSNPSLPNSFFTDAININFNTEIKLENMKNEVQNNLIV